jgi:hypothetical protein
MKLTETEIKTFKPLPSRTPLGVGWRRSLPSHYAHWSAHRDMANQARRRNSYVTLGESPALTVKEARLELAKRMGRATPVNALTVRDARNEWYANEIAPTASIKNSRKRRGALSPQG